MHPTYFCPNPTCTHAFAPDAVKGVSKLVCPKCGTVFHFTAASTAPARPANPVKKAPPPPRPAPPPSPPSQAVPMAQPVAAPKVPLAAPVEAPPSSSSLDFTSSPGVVAPRQRRGATKTGKRRGSRWIGYSIAAVVALALAVWGGMWLKHYLKMAQSDDDANRAPSAYNARFALPGKPWLRDKDMQMKFHVHLGMKSADSNNGLAVLFKDYKTRMPSDAEMLDEALGKLRSYFQGLEWEAKPSDEPARLAGRPARRIEFQGDTADQVTMNGECYMMAYRGYGYWFFTWAPLGDLQQDGDAVRANWAQLRQRLTLSDGRKGWKEKPRETEGVAGRKAKYRLAYVKGLWTVDKGGDEGEVDLLLHGHEPDAERKPLAGKDALFQVLVLPKQANLKAATRAALDFVKQREMKLYEQMKMEAIKDKNGDVDGDAAIGAEAGHLSKWRMKCTEDLERYLLVAVVNRPDGVIVLVGDSLWERRDFWDQEFTVLLATFQAKAR
jgi:hypothetical protein